MASESIVGNDVALIDNTQSTLLFGGAITTQQLIIIIAAVIGIALALTFAKKIFKLIVSVVIAIAGCIYFGIVSPEQMGDVAKYLKDNGTAMIEQISEKTNNIKVDISEENVAILISDGDKWIDVGDIEKMILSDNKATLLLKDSTTMVLEDSEVINLLKLLKK